MIQRLLSVHLISKRTYKNFGHKRERIPLPTTLWHGFLTFTFIGAALEWNVYVLLDFYYMWFICSRISKLIFGDQDFDEDLQKAMSIGKLKDS